MMNEKIRIIYLIKIEYKNKIKIKAIFNEKELEKIANNKKIKKAVILKRIKEKSLF